MDGKDRMKLSELFGYFALGALLAASPLGCGDSNDNGTGLDAGPTADASAPDAQIPRSLCPHPDYPNPECGDQAACVTAAGESFTEVTETCEFCRPFSASVCTFGQCELREDLAEGGLLVPSGGASLTVNLGGLAGASAFLAALALQAETTGGERLTCDGFRDGSQTLIDNDCTNIVETRTTEVDGVTESHTLSFSRFPGDREILFVAYAFADPDAATAPIGVYCTRQRVPAEPADGTFVVPSEDGFELMTDLR